eukprot:1159089-Pelagomonas_calceolata.AAC.7
MTGRKKSKASCYIASKKQGHREIWTAGIWTAGTSRDHDALLGQACICHGGCCWPEGGKPKTELAWLETTIWSGAFGT